jgi:hypothetical protein
MTPADDFDGGRNAPPAVLRADLASAGPGFLEGALVNPALTPQHVTLALRNPAAPSSFIRKVAANPDWIKAHEVKTAIVLHPRTPRALAMNLVGHLWWRDLVRVSDRMALAPPLRRAAERLLATRLQELALGERIALARIAGRGLIGALRRDESPGVVRALLGNPRIVEEDVVAMAVAATTPREVLRAVAEDPRWSCRPPVQKAIVRHPETPRSVALRFLRVLSRPALRELMAAPKVPHLVKVAIERLLLDRETGRGPGGGNAPR